MVNARFSTLHKARPILRCMQGSMVHLEMRADPKMHCSKVWSETVCREGNTMWVF